MMLGVEPEENQPKSGSRQSFSRTRSPSSSKLLSDRGGNPEEELRPLSLSLVSSRSPESGPLPEPQLIRSRGNSLLKEDEKRHAVASSSESRIGPKAVAVGVAAKKLPEWDPEWGPPVRKGRASKSEAPEWDPFFGPPVVRGACLKAWESERGKTIAGAAPGSYPAGAVRKTFDPQRRDPGFAYGGGVDQGVSASLLVQAGHREPEYGRPPQAGGGGVHHTAFMGYQAPPPVPAAAGASYPYPPQPPVVYPAPANPLPSAVPPTQHYKPLPSVTQTTSNSTIPVFSGYATAPAPTPASSGYSPANAEGDHPSVPTQEPQRCTGATITDNDI